MKKVFFVLVVVSYFSSLYAQPNESEEKIRHGLGSQGSFPPQKVEQKKININIKIHNAEYYKSYIVQNGWYKGVGKIECKGGKVPHDYTYYYKFSNKNKAGHWTLVQRYDGYDNLCVDDNDEFYLMNLSDNGDKEANAEWKEKISTVCQWLFVGTEDGKNVAQVYTLDAQNNVIYTCVETKIGSNKYLKTFLDSYGRHAFMRTDTTGNDLGQANFIEITRNKNGYDSLYCYVDRIGIPQKNYDGAYMTRKEYDEYGHIIKTMSLNILGMPMTNEYGHCGFIHKYNKNGSLISAMSIDKDGKFDKNYFNSKRLEIDDDVFGYWYEYNKYGQLEKQGYLDSLERKCTNKYGAYIQSAKYNKHGKATNIVALDKDGKISAMDSLGVSEITYTVDKFGNYTSHKSLDKQGNLVNNEKGICEEEWGYDKDGKTLKKNIQRKKEGDTILNVYSNIIDFIGNTEVMWKDKDLIKVDSVDERGNITMSAYYDLHRQPKEYVDIIEEDTIGKYHRIVFTYKYDTKKQTMTKEFFDVEGKPVLIHNQYPDFDYTKFIQISDSTNREKRLYYYNNSYLQDAIKYSLEDERLDSYISKTMLSVCGKPSHTCRNNWTYYSQEYDLIYNNEPNLIKGINEFGEPSYMSCYNWVFHLFYSNNNILICMDEFGNQIPKDSMYYFAKSLPKVYSIEVTDTTKAYALGIKDNDIILSYGDWRVSKDLKTYTDLDLEMRAKASSEKTMTILRHHPDAIHPNSDIDESEIIKLSLPKGSCDKIGISPHLIYYTQKEKYKLIQTADKANFEFRDLISDGNNVAEIPIVPDTTKDIPLDVYRYDYIKPIVGKPSSNNYLNDKEYSYNWKDYSGDLSIKQLVKDLDDIINDENTPNKNTSLAASEECYHLSIKDLKDHLPLVYKKVTSTLKTWDYFSFTIDYHNEANQKAIELINHLNKTDYVSLRDSCKYPTPDILIAKPGKIRKGEQYYKDILYVFYKNIFILQGECTLKQITKLCIIPQILKASKKMMEDWESSNNDEQVDSY